LDGFHGLPRSVFGLAPKPPNLVSECRIGVGIPSSNFGTVACVDTFFPRFHDGTADNLVTMLPHECFVESPPADVLCFFAFGTGRVESVQALSSVFPKSQDTCIVLEYRKTPRTPLRVFSPSEPNGGCCHMASAANAWSLQKSHPHQSSGIGMRGLPSTMEAAGA